MKRGTTW